MPNKHKHKRATPTKQARSPEILDVQGTAGLLKVSADTVYDLFASGDLPGRKVGRKWMTTRAAVLRWIESSSNGNTVARAIERGDSVALKEAINSGLVKLRPKDGG
jgi:excisionase family DNA binding protein